MKKQLLALTCALTLGVGGAVVPAAGQSVEPTARVGYVLAKSMGAAEGGRNAGAGAGSALGGRVGERASKPSGYRVIRGVSARIVVVRSVATGARIGATAGAFAGLAGLAVGAAVGAL